MNHAIDWPRHQERYAHRQRIEAMTDPEQTPALKACPFCGGDVRLTESRPTNFTKWQIACAATGCGVAPATWSDSRTHTIDKWNRRAPSPSVSEREEVMRLARQHGESVKDERGRESFEFDDYGLIDFADALLATYTIQRKP